MRAILLILVFIITFVISFPKQKVYFLILNNLSNYDIQLQTKNKNISPLGIDLKSNDIYMSKSQIGHIDSIDIGLFGLSLNNVKFSGTIKQMIPDIKEVNIYLSMGEFLNISGEFGKIVGNIDLIKREIKIIAKMDVNNYNRYKNIFGVFKQIKNKKGEYIYELNI